MVNRPAITEPFTTTIDYPDSPAFSERAHILVSGDASLSLWGEIKRALSVFRAARRTRALLLDSTSGRLHPDLLGAILVGTLPRPRPVVVFMGAMWQKDSGLAGAAQRAMIRLADRVVSRYAVQSTGEMPLFSAAWGISGSKLRFTPYFYTFTAQDLASPAPAAEDFIFSGGNAHRDYDTYLQAIESLPEHRFVIASRNLEGKHLPRNVCAKPVSRAEFIRLMRASAAVVVPLRRGLIRATGQQTYLNSMMLGKPTVVTRTLGVDDHIPSQDYAWVVDGSAESYVRAVKDILDPANRDRVEQVTARARQRVLEQFTFEKHAACVVEVLDEAIQERWLSG